MSHSPGFYDDLLVVDSTPIECGRSVETMRRSALGDAADYGYCASHSRYFWGFRLHGLFASVESIFWTGKDMLGLENHRARRLHTLRASAAHHATSPPTTPNQPVERFI